MSGKELDRLIELVADHNQADSIRIEAIHELGFRGYTVAVPTLLEAAGDDTEAQAVQAAAGAALALLYLASDNLLEAPLHNLTGAAYVAFDDTVAKEQAGR